MKQTGIAILIAIMMIFGVQKVSAQEEGGNNYYWKEEIDDKEVESLLNAGGILVVSGLVWLCPASIGNFMKAGSRLGQKEKTIKVTEWIEENYDN